MIVRRALCLAAAAALASDIDVVRIDEPQQQNQEDEQFVFGQQ